MGVEKFHKNDHGYTLDDGVGEREISRRLAFSSRFAGVPQVFTGFSMLDVTNGVGYDMRVHSKASETDEYGFEVGLKTCVSSKIWSAQISWIAFDPRLMQGIAKDEMYICASLTKMSIHQPNYHLNQGNNARHSDKSIVFEPPYQQPPQVAVFLNSFDLILSAPPEEEDEEHEEAEVHGQPIDARVAVSDEHRSNYGFDLRFATWSDSRVWSASATWIAIGNQRPPIAAYREEEEEEIEEEDEEYEEFEPYERHVVNFDEEDGEDEEFIADEDEEDEEIEEEEEYEDDDRFYLPPRAGPPPKRALSIPIIDPDGPTASSAPNGDGRAPPAKKPKLAETENNEDEDSGRECKVCMDATINTVLIPCGHVAICFECAQMLRQKGNKDCPICKTPVTTIVKTFKV